jgi:hypothetical protein
LGEGTALVEGIQHLDVEGGRFVVAAHGVVEQDIGVFEKSTGDGYA